MMTVDSGLFFGPPCIIPHTRLQHGDGTTV